MSRLATLARLGIEPDALAVLEAYGKTLPRDIKLLDEKALAEMKLRGEQLGRLNALRAEVKAAKGKAEPEAAPAPAPKVASRKKVTK